MLRFIPKYFPEFEQEKLEKFEKALHLHREWNEKINVISRKDIDNLECHHYLHSLSLLKFVNFQEGMEILDVGTGGGFPGIPLAIALPKVQFFLLDSIQKKLKIIEDIKQQLNLSNVKVIRSRVEDYKSKHDILTARAVTSLPHFYSMVKKNVKKRIIYIKGGDFAEELAQIKLPYEIYSISEKIQEPFFETKKIVSLRIV
ncbi:MAG: ribosomal RNA small subunit methyltransferase G [Bacteroidia bacterium]|nr:MAG: ribosomal RNA small subunit methyltransferase G [Bacteroidia bacterium]